MKFKKTLISVWMPVVSAVMPSIIAVFIAMQVQEIKGTLTTQVNGSLSLIQTNSTKEEIQYQIGGAISSYKSVFNEISSLKEKVSSLEEKQRKYVSIMLDKRSWNQEWYSELRYQYAELSRIANTIVQEMLTSYLTKQKLSLLNSPELGLLEYADILSTAQTLSGDVNALEKKFRDIHYKAENDTVWKGQVLLDDQNIDMHDLLSRIESLKSKIANQIASLKMLDAKILKKDLGI